MAAWSSYPGQGSPGNRLIASGSDLFLLICFDFGGDLLLQFCAALPTRARQGIHPLLELRLQIDLRLLRWDQEVPLAELLLKALYIVGGQSDSDREQFKHFCLKH